MKSTGFIHIRQFHHEAGFENSVLNGLWSDSWKQARGLGGLGQSWEAAQASCPPAPPGTLGPASSPSKHWVSAFLTSAERRTELKLAKSTVEHAGKQNGTRREADRAGPAYVDTRPPCCPRFLTVPSGGFPDKRGASYRVSAVSSKDDTIRLDSSRLLLKPVQTTVRSRHAFSPLRCSYEKKLWASP